MPKVMSPNEACTKIKEAMYQMGDTADDVASFLRQRNIAGKPEDSDECPGAVYLKSVLEDTQYSVYVGETDVCVSLVHDRYLPMPPGLRMFVRCFDSGDYTDLRSESFREN